MKKFLVGALLAALVAAPLTPVVASDPDPRVTCSGYPEPRVFLETQDWWNPIPDLGGTGHLHLGTCFPVGQTLSGTVVFDVRVMVHENKGELVRLKMQDDKSRTHILLKPNITPPDGGMHTYWFRVSVNTKLMIDGIRQFRWYADLEHSNGNRQTARSAWPVDVENGTTDKNASSTIRFLNWYKVANPVRDWGYTGPIITQTGPLTVSVKCSKNGPSGSPAIDRTIVHADPDFHAGSDGTVVANQAGAWSGKVTVPPGTQRVVVRCQQVDGSETHEGVGVLPLRP